MALLGPTSQARSGRGGSGAEGTHSPPGAAGAVGLFIVLRVAAAGEAAPPIYDARHRIREAGGHADAAPPQNPRAPASSADGLQGRPAARGPRPLCACGGALEPILVAVGASAACADCAVHRKHSSRVWRCTACKALRCPTRRMARRAAAQPSHGGGEDADSGHVALQSQPPGRVASQPLQPEPELPASPGIAVQAPEAPPEPALLLALRSIPKVPPVVTPTYCPKGLAKRFGSRCWRPCSRTCSWPWMRALTTSCWRPKLGRCAWHLSHGAAGA